MTIKDAVYDNATPLISVDEAGNHTVIGGFSTDSNEYDCMDVIKHTVTAAEESAKEIYIEWTHSSTVITNLCGMIYYGGSAYRLADYAVDMWWEVYQYTTPITYIGLYGAFYEGDIVNVFVHYIYTDTPQQFKEIQADKTLRTTNATGNCAILGGLSTDSNEFFCTDIIQHTITTEDVSAGSFTEHWDKTTADKIYNYDGVIYYYNGEGGPYYEPILDVVDRFYYDVESQEFYVDSFWFSEGDIWTLIVHYEKNEIRAQCTEFLVQEDTYLRSVDTEGNHAILGGLSTDGNEHIFTDAIVHIVGPNEAEDGYFYELWDKAPADLIYDISGVVSYDTYVDPMYWYEDWLFYEDAGQYIYIEGGELFSGDIWTITVHYGKA